MGQAHPSIGLVLVPAFGERGSFTPLGLAYLNGALREAGFEPTYHDINAAVRREDPDLQGELVAHGFSPDEGGFFGPELPLLLELGRRDAMADAPLADRILARARLDADRLPPLDLALLTLWDSNLYYATALGRVLRERGTRVVMGGPSAQLQPVRELMVRLGAADAVVYGEGEVRVVEIARRTARGQSLEGIGGATLRGPDGRGVETLPTANLLVHSVPRPSFVGMPRDQYLPLITSRGCIRDCSFCTEKFNWRKFRQRRVEDVLDEMESLLDRYDIQSFEFNDDLINGHVRWLDTFLDALIERQWGIRWTCFMEPYRLSSEMIDKVARAGCTLVKYGVQHFDREMLRVIGRGDEVSEVVDTLRRTADHGIRVSFDIIPGHPGETERAHEVNMRMLPEVLSGHDLLEANLNPFLLLYGSPVHLQPELYGVDIQFWDETLFPVQVRGEFADLAPQFIRSYTQEPTRDVVIERTRQLEGVAVRARARHGVSSVPAPHEGPLPELLDRLRARGVERVALRPEPTTTPRDLLTGFEAASRRGFSVVALETTGAPLDRAAFVQKARLRGFNHALLVPGGPGELRAAAADVLGEAGIPWVFHVEPQPGELSSAVHYVAEASALGARAVVLDVATAVDGADGVSLLAAAAIARRAIEVGSDAGLPVLVHGVPFCHLPDLLDHLAASAPILPLSLGGRPLWSAFVRQPPRCRSCALSNRCPGAPEGALAREGDAVLRPLHGRPNQSREATLVDMGVWGA
ncbi:MAG: radical SAM protein [Deltaproteobacteria bacterium]|nr:radical SAM protein [Deltaproteobacteria bacterium]MCB9788595.1 radical SAM protein [Deltaproteobacteria bacterium]